MMLIFVLLLCMNVRAQVETFKLTPSDAEQNSYSAGWTWNTLPRYFQFAAGETKQFAVDLSGMTGAKDDGETVTLTDHYRVGVHLDSTNQITGYFECTAFEDETDPTCSYASVCNPSLGTQTFNVKNTGEAQEIGISFSADGDDGLCEVGEEVLNWLKTFLIIIGVSFALCICLIVLGCMGVISCCCFQRKPQTQVIRLEQTNAGRQPGEPDLAPYNAGLQPGWEAKWDANTQNVYWVNHNTQTNSWVDPRITSGV